MHAVDEAGARQREELDLVLCMYPNPGELIGFHTEVLILSLCHTIPGS